MLFAIKNLRASGVNLLMNDFAAGLPSPLAFIGLADAIARRLDLLPWSARVLPILHRVDVAQGRTKPEMESKSGVFTPIETMEDLTGTIEVSLLVDLPDFERASALREVISDLRMAGGGLQNHDYKVDAVTPDGSAFRTLRRGYVVIRPDRKDRRIITTGDTEGLTTIAATLFPPERPLGFGWIVAAAVGYRIIEDPETAPKRIRTRSRDVPHVFAEPVLGIAELVSVRNRRMTELTGEGLSELFWSWDVKGNHVLGHPAYHLESLYSPKETENV